MIANAKTQQDKNENKFKLIHILNMSILKNICYKQM